jgi:hypothetical protein
MRLKAILVSSPTISSADAPAHDSETASCRSIQRAPIAWNPDRGGHPGLRDVFVPPTTNGGNIVVQIKKACQGQPKEIAAALYGNSAAQYRYRDVTAVEEANDASSNTAHGPGHDATRPRAE